MPPRGWHRGINPTKIMYECDVIFCVQRQRRRRRRAAGERSSEKTNQTASECGDEGSGCGSDGMLVSYWFTTVAQRYDQSRQAVNHHHNSLLTVYNF